MRQVLASRLPFSPWVVLSISVPGIIAIPLTEAHGSFEKLLALFLISILTVFLALGVFAIFALLYKQWDAPWWLSPIIATITGTLKGLLTWYLVNQLGYLQPSLWSRLVFSGISWGILIPAAAILASTINDLRDQTRQLRLELIDSERLHETLDQQLDWLVRARLEGLGQELASKFVRLVAQLNEEGHGPRAYQNLAHELRMAARQQVRQKSFQAWNKSRPVKVKQLFNRMLRTATNPQVSLIVFFSGAGINSLRVDGLSIQFATVSATSIIFWVLLSSLKKKEIYQHLTPLALAVLIAAVYQIFEFDLDLIWQTSVATWVWAELSLIAGVVWAATIDALRLRKMELQSNFALSESETTWLASRLESNNIQVAKYLHSILQTRLMAYAMKLENKNDITHEDLLELEELLSRPFSEFGKQIENLNDGIANLARAWASLALIEFTLAGNPERDTEITLQILSEAVANGVKHANADKFEIHIQDNVNERMITVINNGLKPGQIRRGLGTSIFNSLSSSHSLVPGKNDGATFTAIIPI